MRKTIAAATIAVGGLGVLGLGATTIAAAQDDTGDTTDDTTADDGGWVQDALTGLVEDGTITREQADAVEGALEDARPGHHFGPGWHGFGLLLGGDLDTVAESLGVEEEALRDALHDGRTIAEVAEEEGVAVGDVVADIVASQQERVDEAVADGDITQEDADELMAGAEERVTAFVNGEAPDLDDLPDLDVPHPFGDGEGPGGWRGHGPWGDGPWGGHDDESGSGGDDSGGDESGEDSGDGSDGSAEGSSFGSSFGGSGDAGATTA
jgi:hypothetical protein